MTIFYQHVGERGGGRDFPRTIGTSQQGLRVFKVDEIEPLLVDLAEDEQKRLLLRLREEREFQIWGFPAGADVVLSRMKMGDWMLLLDTDRPGGRFVYGGRLLARPESPLPGASEQLWGEGKFSWIVFLKGVLAEYDWETFRDTLGYSPNLELRGKTNSVSPAAIARSTYRSEAGLLKTVLGVDA
jgi:hypothetical protein